MSNKRNIVVEVGVVLNFPVALLGLIGFAASHDEGGGYLAWVAVAGVYNLFAYFLLARKINALRERLES